MWEWGQAGCGVGTCTFQTALKSWKKLRSAKSEEDFLLLKKKDLSTFYEELNCTEEDSQTQRQIDTEAMKSLFKDLKQKLNNSEILQVDLILFWHTGVD